MPMSERVCIICEKTYTPWNRDQKCCTKECMDQNLKNRLEKRHKKFTCKNCGIDFTNTGKGVKRKTYCSKNCADKGKAEWYEGMKEGKKLKTQKKRKYIKCLICQKDVPSNKRRYCSEECSKQGQLNLNRIRDKSRHQSRKEKAWAIKQEFVDKKGGCCEKCCYNNCLAALTFHHIDENTKEYTLDISSIQRYNKEILEKELDKCQLLCFNCHMEIHHMECTRTL